MPPQTTLGRVVSLRGQSLHHGGESTTRLHPAAPDTGIVFRHSSLPGRVPAHVSHVVQTTLATTIGNGQWSVATVEHLLAALLGVGLDNVEIEVDSPEVPALDGSAAGWVQAIEEAGLVELSAARRTLVLRSPVEVRQGDRVARLLPCEELELSAQIDFAHRSVGRQELTVRLEPGAFSRELAWARTFGFMAEVDQMRSMGLAQGGGLHNAVVFGADGPLNPGGLRAPNELVRHKLLDMVGDLALVGMPVRARMEAERPGHALTVALVARLMSQPQAWVVEAEAPPAAAR